MDWTQIVSDVLVSLFPIATGYVIAVMHKGFSYLAVKSTQIKDDTTRNAVSSATWDLQNVCDRIVNSLNQTVVNDLKAQNGGKLSSSDAVRIKKDAIASVLTNISSGTKEILSAHYSDLTTVISHMIEQAVGFKSTTSLVPYQAKPLVMQVGSIETTTSNTEQPVQAE